jgi:hypothetical protein
MSKQRSQAARQATIQTAGQRADVISAASDWLRAKVSRSGVRAAERVLLSAVTAYEKPDFSWYGGKVDRNVVRDIVRLKREGKL